MGDPLAAAHELIVDRLSERVAHAAVITGKTDAATHGGRQIVDLFLLDLRHRVDRHDKAHVGDRRICEGFGRVFDITLKPSPSSISPMMWAPFSGSCPLHPPQTISASRMPCSS